MLHNSQAFLAELKLTSAALAKNRDWSNQILLDRAIITLETGELVETEQTLEIAKRFLN
ncbi:hypothetical protein [Rhizobium arsenicireducens]